MGKSPPVDAGGDFLLGGVMRAATGAWSECPAVGTPI
jgi:hypothetical protein